MKSSFLRLARQQFHHSANSFSELLLGNNQAHYQVFVGREVVEEPWVDEHVSFLHHRNCEILVGMAGNSQYTVPASFCLQDLARFAVRCRFKLCPIRFYALLYLWLHRSPLRQ